MHQQLERAGQAVEGQSKWGTYVGNWTGYAPIGHSGVELQTMDTYYGVQPLSVKGLLPASIASWKSAVPTEKLTIGFGGLYAAWGDKNCAMTPGDPLLNVSGINQVRHATLMNYTHE